MLRSVDIEPGPHSDRQREIDARLAAIRERLGKLRERNRDAVNDRTASVSERLEAAQRHQAQARAAAAFALTSAVQAFRTAAQAHERVASAYEKMAASRIGDVQELNRHAALHRAAALTDWQRADRAQLLVCELDGAGPADYSRKPGDGLAS